MGGIIGWVLFGLLAVLHLSFLRYSTHHVEQLSEYVEFLFQNKVVYDDHRRKYAEVLADMIHRSPGISATDIARGAKRALDEVARGLHSQAFVSNVAGRGMPTEWFGAASVAEAMQRRAKP
jgi:hypothetical protein